MDYEKAYTEAVSRAKQAIKDCGHNEGRKRMIEDIFPELADPDRIRQELIQYLKDYPNLPNGRYCRDDFFAWLEKQGEQKSADSYCKENCKGFQETSKCYADGECKAKKNEDIKNELLKHLVTASNGQSMLIDTDCYKRWATWLEKQCERKPDWNEYDMVVINAIYNTLKHSNVTKCGVEVTEMLEWLEELEKQGKRNSADPFLNWLEKQGEQNNIVEQLTAFAQHLQKRGAFCDDLCMDFEHEAQSFIEDSIKKE